MREAIVKAGPFSGSRVKVVRPVPGHYTKAYEVEYPNKERGCIEQQSLRFVGRKREEKSVHDL